MNWIAGISSWDEAKHGPGIRRPSSGTGSRCNTMNSETQERASFRLADGGLWTLRKQHCAAIVCPKPFYLATTPRKRRRAYSRVLPKGPRVALPGLRRLDIRRLVDRVGLAPIALVKGRLRIGCGFLQCSAERGLFADVRLGLADPAVGRGGVVAGACAVDATQLLRTFGALFL